jgi:hypothetical protein
MKESWADVLCDLLEAGDGDTGNLKVPSGVEAPYAENLECWNAAASCRLGQSKWDGLWVPVDTDVELFYPERLNDG